MKTPISDSKELTCQQVIEITQQIRTMAQSQFKETDKLLGIIVSELEDYEENIEALERENKILRVKYPQNVKKLNTEAEDTLQAILDDDISYPIIS